MLKEHFNLILPLCSDYIESLILYKEPNKFLIKNTVKIIVVECCLSLFFFIDMIMSTIDGLEGIIHNED